LEEETGDEGRSTAEGDDGLGWELTEGGSRRRRWLHFWRRRCASDGRSWIGGRGGEVVLMACLQRRKRGWKRKGRAASVMPFISAAGGSGRRGGGGSGVEFAWKREKGREKGGIAWRSAAGTGPWLMGAGRWRTHARHDAEQLNPGADERATTTHKGMHSVLALKLGVTKVLISAVLTVGRKPRVDWMFLRTFCLQN
jgi:hypothetical protein